MVIDKIVIQETEPQQRNVIWVKPVYQVDIYDSAMADSMAEGNKTSSSELGLLTQSVGGKRLLAKSSANNAAADDAEGLSVSEKMRKGIRGATEEEAGELSPIKGNNTYVWLNGSWQELNNVLFGKLQKIVSTLTTNVTNLQELTVGLDNTVKVKLSGFWSELNGKTVTLNYLNKEQQQTINTTSRNILSNTISTKISISVATDTTVTFTGIPAGVIYTIEVDTGDDYYISDFINPHIYKSGFGYGIETYCYKIMRYDEADTGVKVVSTDGTLSTLTAFKTANSSEEDKGVSKIAMIYVATKELMQNGGVFYLDPAAIHEASKARDNGVLTYSEGMQWKGGLKWADDSSVLGQNSSMIYENYAPTAIKLLSGASKSSKVAIVGGGSNRPSSSVADVLNEYYYGYLYTQSIINAGDAKGIETPAADWAWSFVKTIGSYKYQGFLPSTSQWKAAWDNSDGIDEIIAFMFADDSPEKGLAHLIEKGQSSRNMTVWTSIQYGSTCVCFNGDKGSQQTYSKTYTNANLIAAPFFNRIEQ